MLTLYNNQLTGTIPASIGNAQHLTNFDITNNAIFGTIPASLGNITTLKYAVLKFNKLSGALLPHSQPIHPPAHQHRQRSSCCITCRSSASWHVGGFAAPGSLRVVLKVAARVWKAEHHGAKVAARGWKAEHHGVMHMQGFHEVALLLLFNLSMV